jgi:hypothetical protein
MKTAYEAYLKIYGIAISEGSSRWATSENPFALALASFHAKNNKAPASYDAFVALVEIMGGEDE